MIAIISLSITPPTTLIFRIAKACFSHMVVGSGKELQRVGLLPLPGHCTFDWFSRVCLILETSFMLCLKVPLNTGRSANNIFRTYRAHSTVLMENKAVVFCPWGLKCLCRACHHRHTWTAALHGDSCGKMRAVPGRRLLLIIIEWRLASSLWRITGT